jgi:hypothetical protein
LRGVGASAEQVEHESNYECDANALLLFSFVPRSFFVNGGGDAWKTTEPSCF